jgi:hypothetical protein
VFQHPIAAFQEILDSFDRVHNDLRSRLSYQPDVLRELPSEP